MKIKYWKTEKYKLKRECCDEDACLCVWPAVGLPLNLTLNGSASVELKASGKMDFTKIKDRQRAFEISASLQPR